jgi:hypothetical protein
VVSVVKESKGGWPTWTEMKMAPATAAAAPAALVRPVAVTFMRRLLVRPVPGAEVRRCGGR